MAWNREVKFSIYKFLIAVLVVLLFVYIAYLTLDSPYPDGHDVWFHIMVARAWFKGENGMVCPAAIYYNGIPYPPLFHLMLAPFCSSQQLALGAAKGFQLFFYPLAILFFMLLVNKYSGSKTALIAGLALGHIPAVHAVAGNTAEPRNPVLFPRSLRFAGKQEMGFYRVRGGDVLYS